uniref:Uncharacterized protein n=1 Tax=Arundo donax TaxID=35708 RepID=A0A0A9GQI5_ARUDO
MTLEATGAWGLQAEGPVRKLESADDASRGSEEPESDGRFTAGSCAVPSPGFRHWESSESAPELAAAGAGVLGPSLASTRFFRYEFQ